MGFLGHNKIDFELSNESSAYRSYPGCYYCVVNASNPSLEEAEKYAAENPADFRYNLAKRKNAYYTALAVEKMKLSKASNFINGSGSLP